jgi:hypothetical protein
MPDASIWTLTSPLRVAHLDFLDLPGLVELPDECAFGLHCVPPLEKAIPEDVRVPDRAGWSIKDKLERVPVLGDIMTCVTPVTTGRLGC